jgi:hypothetical protein
MTLTIVRTNGRGGGLKKLGGVGAAIETLE